MKKENENNPPIDNTEKDTYIDDVLFEADDNFAKTEGKISELKERLKKCLAERKEYLDGWQRAKADFLNFKKGEEKSKDDFVKFAKESLISELIPTLDSFVMAFSNKEAWEKADKNWRVGIEYIYSQLLATLMANGLEEISPKQESFDPFKHDCAETVPVSEEKMDGMIIETIRNGYSLNGKIIRAAKVKVGEFQNKKS